MHKRLLILGTHGVPAQYGGFEALAEELSLYLTRNGWRVTVYCKEDWNRTVPYETMWGRVRRVHIPVKQSGLLGSMIFGYKAALHARKQPTMALTLGYNNAIFSLLQRLRGKTNLFHMGDISYQGARHSPLVKIWLKLNERIAYAFSTHLLVDNPEIKNYHCQRTKDYNITTIPNGSLATMDASSTEVRDLGLEPGKFSTVIALPTIDHSLLEIVQAFSQEPRGHSLVVLGDFHDDNTYHQQVLASASQEVKFVGAIYDRPTLRALRYHSYFYIHGHQNGGTSPSLVDALGAGNPILAFDTPSNRWVTGPDAAVFFNDTASCAAGITQLLTKPDQALEMRKAARLRHAEAFTLEHILPKYEKLLTSFNPYEPEPEGWEQYLDN